MAYNAARKGGDSFSGASRFDVEDLFVDLHVLLIWQKYKAQKRTKRVLLFCDTKYKHVLKHVSTRWLRLIKAVSHTLEMYKLLKIFICQAQKNSQGLND